MTNWWGRKYASLIHRWVSLVSECKQKMKYCCTRSPFRGIPERMSWGKPSIGQSFRHCKGWCTWNAEIVGKGKSICRLTSRQKWLIWLVNVLERTRSKTGNRKSGEVSGKGIFESKHKVWRSLYHTLMLSREHPLQKRHETTSWTRWLSGWTSSNFCPWPAQCSHYELTKTVATVAELEAICDSDSMTSLDNANLTPALCSIPPTSRREQNWDLRRVPLLKKTLQPLVASWCY